MQNDQVTWLVAKGNRTALRGFYLNEQAGFGPGIVSLRSMGKQL